VKPKDKQVKHHPAMAWRDVPTLMVELAEIDGMSARALELCILSGTRTGETINARWPEFDLATRVWAIPAHRTKTDKPHRIPISDQMLDLLIKLQPLAKGDGHVFPGSIEHGEKPDWFWPISNMAMLMQLRRLRPEKDEHGRSTVTTHGFRSSLRDFLADHDVPREIAEACLGHALGSAVEAAYFRSDVLVRRAVVMQQWADHCRPMAPLAANDADGADAPDEALTGLGSIAME
jgi:integrase